MSLDYSRQFLFIAADFTFIPLPSASSFGFGPYRKVVFGKQPLRRLTKCIHFRPFYPLPNWTHKTEHTDSFHANEKLRANGLTQTSHGDFNNRIALFFSFFRFCCCWLVNTLCQPSMVTVPCGIIMASQSSRRCTQKRTQTIFHRTKRRLIIEKVVVAGENRACRCCGILFNENGVRRVRCRYDEWVGLIHTGHIIYSHR